MEPEIADLLEQAAGLCRKHGLRPIGTSGGHEGDPSRAHFRLHLTNEDFERLLAVEPWSALLAKPPCCSGNDYGRISVQMGDLAIVALFHQTDHRAAWDRLSA